MAKAAAALLTMLALSTAAPLQSPRAADAAEHAIRAALDTGDYEAAEHDAAQRCEALDANPREPSLNIAHALDLLVEALLENGRGRESRTVSAADRAIRLKEAALGADDLDTAISVRNRAAIHFFRGEFRQAK